MPPPLAVLRTVRCVCIDVPGLLLRVSSSTSADGIAEIQQRFARVLARLALSLTISHADRLPPVGGFTLMWNQTSHLDHLIVGLAVSRPFFTLYNNAVARFPLYGRILRDSGHVHVDRTDPAQWRPAIARAAARVAAGECVIVSPEGTRSRDGALLPFKKGAFQLACAAARPIVCLTVRGAHEALPRGAFVVRPGRITVDFSPPIATDAAEDVVMARVAAALRV